MVPRRRYDPFADIVHLQSRLGQLAQAFFGTPMSVLPAAIESSLTRADIEETDDAFIVELDLPNVRPGDISVELRDENELRVYGTIPEREHEGTVRRHDRRTGEFEHLIVLPGDVDPEKVDATLENGVLTVRMPKSGQRQPHRIEVRAGDESSARDQSGGARTRPGARDQSSARDESDTGDESRTRRTAKSREAKAG